MRRDLLSGGGGRACPVLLRVGGGGRCVLRVVLGGGGGGGGGGAGGTLTGVPALRVSLGILVVHVLLRLGCGVPSSASFTCVC